MRTPLVILLLGLAVAGPAQPQIRASARLGGTWSSSLVRDRVVASEVNVDPGLAPTLALGASLPWGPRYRAGLDLALTTGPLTATEPDDEADLGTLRTATLLLTAEGPMMVRKFRWRLGVGLIKYLPSEREGLFRDGGPWRVIGSAGVEFFHPWRPGWEVVAGLRYSYHRFSTAALEARGFSQTQDVHRAWIEVGVARYFQ